MSDLPTTNPGTLVISLDFELIWGVRDQYPPDGGAYRENLLGVRAAIPQMLELFEEYGVSATWATVGMLMAESRDEWESFKPAALPRYVNADLNPYDDPIGTSEADDPLRFAGTLIDQIRKRPGQEIASHTFGHYYPLEPGTDQESFAADLKSAVAIAKAKGFALRSLVFPRNQFNPEYAQIIADAGFTVCRSNGAGWMHKEAASNTYFRTDIRAARLIDTYLPVSGNQVIAWDSIPFVGSLCCLPASMFLRPYSPRLRRLEGMRLTRVASGIEAASKAGGIYHLWWHPHNAGANTDRFMSFLRKVLDVYAKCRLHHDMQSMSMAEVAERAASLRNIG